MTLAEVFTMLKSITGYSNKVAYHSFDEGNAPSLPFICYLETTTNGFKADGLNYFNKKKIQIELYTKTKDISQETLVETQLSTYGIPYSKESGYLFDEKVWMTNYYIEV